MLVFTRESSDTRAPLVRFMGFRNYPVGGVLETLTIWLSKIGTPNGSQVEAWTKPCGPFPGASILAHTHLKGLLQEALTLV